MDNQMMNKLIVENISEGIIAIDRQQKIKIINRSAKEIFGIIYKHNIGHGEGSIKKGDIVLVGDNCLGSDDGGMDVDDLKLLGIHERIPSQSALVYIGRYMMNGDYKYMENPSGEELSISKMFKDLRLSVNIDFIQKNIDIKVNNSEFSYSFIKAIGHVVILDGDTLEVKFYQSKGYTVRKEDLKRVLNGGVFLEKIPGTEMETDVAEERITEVLGFSESVDMLIKSARGISVNYRDKFDEINGRPVRCSVYSLYSAGKSEGAFLKAEDLSEVNRIIKERDELMRKILEIEGEIFDPFNVLIGRSTVMQEVKSYAKKAALSNSTILMLGESGTGKSIAARAIHEYSHRRGRRFVEINCGAIPENLLESELFGYVPGAFTGAKKEGKKGLIEYADGGTLFLDEITEMPLGLQVKLLHVIQNRRITPVGSTESIGVDVRFICASNRNIKKMVQEGNFREDLYYRINVMPLDMPPLRDRKEDIEELAGNLLRELCRKNNINVKLISSQAISKLYNYNYPGNVRELENIIERALYVAEGDVIDESDIMLGSYEVEGIKTLKDVVEEAEKKAISNSIKKYNGDKIKAMEALGIKKTAFYEKLKKYDIL